MSYRDDFEDCCNGLGIHDSETWSDISEHLEEIIRLVRRMCCDEPAKQPDIDGLYMTAAPGTNAPADLWLVMRDWWVNARDFQSPEADIRFYSVKDGFVSLNIAQNYRTHPASPAATLTVTVTLASGPTIEIPARDGLCRILPGFLRKHVFPRAQ